MEQIHAQSREPKNIPPIEQFFTEPMNDDGTSDVSPSAGARRLSTIASRSGGEAVVTSTPWTLNELFSQTQGDAPKTANLADGLTHTSSESTTTGASPPLRPKKGPVAGIGVVACSNENGLCRTSSSSRSLSANAIAAKSAERRTGEDPGTRR